MNIRQRLYRTQEKEKTLLRHCTGIRFVYDFDLEQRNLWQRARSGKITYLAQAKHLATTRQALRLMSEGGYSKHADVNALKNIPAAGLTLARFERTPHAKPNRTNHSEPARRLPPSKLVA